MRFKIIFISVLVLAFSVIPAIGQDGEKKDVAATEATPAPSPTPVYTDAQRKGLAVAESTILLYSSFQGSRGLDRIGKTAVEFGTIEYYDAEGKPNLASYERRTLRGDTLATAKIRFDQKFSDAQYSMIYDGKTVFGVFNDTKFEPRTDAVDAFSDRYWHGLPALMRYRSNGGKVELESEEKRMGVDYNVIRVVDEANRETVFFVSKKSFRVMMLEYEARGVKYRRKFYDYNYAQNVLVPYRTVLWADGKKIEEQKVSTVTFGQEFGDEFFEVG